MDVAEAPAPDAPDSSGFLTAEAPTEGPPPEALAEVAVDDSDSAPADDEPAEADEPSPESVSPIGADSPPSPPGAEGNHAVLSNGQIFLRGSVPNTEITDLTVGAFERILGEGNVTAEYVVDPDTTFDPAADQSVFLAENVLFETGSAVITEEFETILGFSPLLLQQQPDATLWVFGHTDSAGDDAANLTLSENRVEAVKEWIVERGGDPERIFISGEGEAKPIADNATAEGRALNRRVEFTIASFDINR